MNADIPAVAGLDDPSLARVVLYASRRLVHAPASIWLPAGDYTAADVLAKLLTVDGTGSGLDADLLQGVTPSAFILGLLDDADAAAARATLGVGIEKLAAGSVSSAASLDITGLSSTYAAYLLAFSRCVPASNANTLIMRTDSNGGASFDAGGSDYAYSLLQFRVGGSVGAVGSNGAATIHLTASDEMVGNTAAREVAGFVLLLGAQNATATYPRVLFMTGYQGSSGNEVIAAGTGQRLAAANIDAIRLLFSSGNITSMDYQICGLR